MRSTLLHICIGILVACAAPVAVHAERIDSFGVAIELAEAGSFVVTETLVYDFEDAQRHGIFRFLPAEHPQGASAWYRSRYIDVAVRDVTMDGASVPYTTTHSGDSYEIKIGDSDRTVTGAHTYTITYTVRGALFYDNDAVELYWNVTGNGWLVPIEATTVSLVAPAGVLGDAASCYAGVQGAGGACTATSSETDATFTAGPIAPGEGVTIAHALVPGSVGTVVLERTTHALFAFAAGLVLLFALVYGAYRVKMRHRQPRSIVAEYGPYRDVRPMYAGMLVDGSLDARDITAGIVYLAEQGFLTITRTSSKFLVFETSDYEITLRRDGADAPGNFLPQVLELLFGDALEEGHSVTLSEIKRNLPKQQLNQKILRELTERLESDMREEGYFERSFSSQQLWFGAIVGIALLAAGAALLFVSVAYTLLAFFLIIACALATAIVWTRRTQKGYEARAHLRGFKEFLSVTDRDRFAFHNAPEKNPETFLAYLPYAIAFGVEEQWAEVFSDVTVPSPAWYHGSGAFTAAAFTHDLHTFTGSLAAAGTSASSGGGAVGGGAGGGGGGSW